MFLCHLGFLLLYLSQDLLKLSEPVTAVTLRQKRSNLKKGAAFVVYVGINTTFCDEFVQDQLNKMSKLPVSEQPISGGAHGVALVEDVQVTEEQIVEHPSSQAFKVQTDKVRETGGNQG